MINHEKALEAMKEISKIAGDEILKWYKQDFRVEYKEDSSPVTEADKAANEIIVNSLKREFKEIPVLAEESKDDPSRLGKKYCFIVDPLDGTKEFINKNGEFTVNIALVEDERPIVGVIYVPVLEELYYAAKGRGAFMAAKGLDRPITVSSRTGNVRLAKSRSHCSAELERLIEKNHIEKIIVAGSSYKGCLLARGDVEVYYRFGRIMEWDTAAMDIIITEAGGIFCGMDGNLFKYNKEDPRNPTGFYALNLKENALKMDD